MSDPITRLNAALEGRYRIESELGEGGMATVSLAQGSASSCRSTTMDGSRIASPRVAGKLVQIRHLMEDVGFDA